MAKADSFYQLGLDYHHGNGYPQDDDIAIDYLIKASNLNHFEAKVLCADLLFKQAKNTKSIYFEDGYRLGTTYMIDIFRAGKIDITIPYLLNNEIFNETCTVEEMQDYYQEAYRLGHRETKYELAKLLFQKASYLSAEQLFLESIKEDISKESHVYLYQIYLTEERRNEKKAYLHLKEALRNDFVISPYDEFLEHDHMVLVHEKYLDSGFSIDAVKKGVVSYVKETYYADPQFVEWIKPNHIHVEIYFDLKHELENAAYEFEHQDNEGLTFVYEPFELTEGYFSHDENDHEAEQKNKERALKKNSGFYQRQDKPSYKEMTLKDIFEIFDSVNIIPVVHTHTDETEIDQMIQASIMDLIKTKHPDYLNKSIVRIKMFNLFKTLIPSFDFHFTYQDKTYRSKRYAMNDPIWKQQFDVQDDPLKPAKVNLNMELPLNPEVFNELEALKKEGPKYRKWILWIAPLKILSLAIFVWSLGLFVANRFMGESIYLSNYQIIDSFLAHYLWYLGGMLAIAIGYFATRLEVFDLSIDNLSEIIMKNPSFQLPQGHNQKHFSMQLRMILFTFIIALLLFLVSGFLPILR